MKEINTPYFSIILPIYNVAAYLEDCIQSVLNQNFFDYELILVDDGSTDESGKICDAYAEKYASIRVIHKENGGLSSARNAGTADAKGMYLWWVDSDDRIEPGALEILHGVTSREEPDIVKFNFNRAGKACKSIVCDVKPGTYGPLALLDKCFFSPGKFSLSAWGHLYKSSFLAENRLSFVSEREIGSEDYLFNLTAFAAADKICVIPEHLYSYRLREGSLTQRYREQLPQKYTKLFACVCQEYEHMGLLKEYEAHISRFYIWHLLHGTCFANEYRVTDSHSQKEGRKNVRRFLRLPEARRACRLCSKHGFSRNERIQVFAMRLGFEPLFYRLFVEKPQIKKDQHHEN